MSGHNKWSKIKHKKAASDAEKSKSFGKLVSAIKMEARRSQGAPSVGLTSAIEKARAANVPKDTIDRAIKNATSASETIEAATYESYGPGGSAIIIDVITDNKNRTASELKHLLSEHSTTLAAPGSAVWAFTKTNEGYVAKQHLALSPEDRTALDTLTNALEERDDVQNVYTNAS